MEQNKTRNIKRWIAYILGLSIIQLGVAIFLDLNWGSDPFTILLQGIANTFSISPGWANRIVTVLMLILLFFIDRKYINVGSIIAIFMAGFILDGMLALIHPFNLSIWPWYLKTVMIVVNCFIIGIGFPFMKQSGLGLAPNDVVYMTIVEHFHFPYAPVRMSVDCLYLVVGYLLKGVVGIGTVICVCILGPIINFVMKRIEDKIIKLLA